MSRLATEHKAVNLGQGFPDFDAPEIVKKAAIDAITDTLKKGDSVSLVGFGTFVATEREARTGRNPRTGVAIKIAKAKVPKFRPGKALKDALN